MGLQYGFGLATTLRSIWLHSIFWVWLCLLPPGKTAGYEVSSRANFGNPNNSSQQEHYYTSWHASWVGRFDVTTSGALKGNFAMTMKKLPTLHWHEYSMHMKLAGNVNSFETLCMTCFSLLSCQTSLVTTVGRSVRVHIPTLSLSHAYNALSCVHTDVGLKFEPPMGTSNRSTKHQTPHTTSSSSKLEDFEMTSTIDFGKRHLQLDSDFQKKKKHYIVSSIRIILLFSYVCNRPEELFLLEILLLWTTSTSNMFATKWVTMRSAVPRLSHLWSCKSSRPVLHAQAVEAPSAHRADWTFETDFVLLEKFWSCMFDNECSKSWQEAAFKQSGPSSHFSTCS